MQLRTHASRGALFLTIVGLAACGTGGQTTALPVAGNVPLSGSTVAANVPPSGSGANSDGSQRKTEHLRAFAADCSATLAVMGSALCTNIEVAGPAIYGPATPATQIPGLKPADLQAAYHLPSASAGGGQTIGVVIGGADPSAEADLGVYRAAFGLPACTVAGGCLQILAAKNDPSADAAWAREGATDLEMASAVCPKCKLILYVAKSTKDGDFAAADTAVIAAGATVVSNSFTIPEGGGESNAMWSHPGVPLLAAAGDQGYGAVNWPAAATDVIAVGATTLVADSTTPRGWRETAWSGSGSGCSALAAKPTWQHDSACSTRTVADVVAVGDPSTPVAVYDSYQDSGWVEVGGSSVSTPIIAGVYGLAANGAKLTGAASLYANTGALFPVLSGMNGSCAAAYLCTANGSYSGLGGLGSPNGIAAF